MGNTSAILTHVFFLPSNRFKQANNQTNQPTGQMLHPIKYPFALISNLAKLSHPNLIKCKPFSSKTKDNISINIISSVRNELMPDRSFSISCYYFTLHGLAVGKCHRQWPWGQNFNNLPLSVTGHFPVR